MKLLMTFLILGVLAVGPWGCNRPEARDESVSANTDRTEPAERKESTTATSEPKPAPKKAAPQPAEPSAPRRTVPDEREDRVAATPAPKMQARASVPSGTALTVTLSNALSTETSMQGDTFVAHLTEPIVVDGKIVAEKGDKIVGHVQTVDEPGRVKGRARLALVLDKLTVNNRQYDIDSEPFTVVAGDNKDRDAGIIAGGAGVGAVIGAVTGGKKGAALGAIIGGGTGTTAVLITKGDHVKLEPETRVNFVLSRDVTLPVIRTAAS